MAKDGTARGGVRPNSGPKRKPLADKIIDGNTSHRKTTVIEFPNLPDVAGVDMPTPTKHNKASHSPPNPLRRAFGGRRIVKWSLFN